MTSDPSGRILSVSQSEDWHKKEKAFFYFKKISEQRNAQKLYFIRLNNMIDSFTNLETTNLRFFFMKPSLFIYSL